MFAVDTHESSIVGTAIQFSGTVLVTLLCALQPGAMLIARAQSDSSSKATEKTVEPQGLTLPLAVDIALKTNPPDTPSPPNR